MAELLRKKKEPQEETLAQRAAKIAAAKGNAETEKRYGPVGTPKDWHDPKWHNSGPIAEGSIEFWVDTEDGKGQWRWMYRFWTCFLSMDLQKKHGTVWTHEGGFQITGTPYYALGILKEMAQCFGGFFKDTAVAAEASVKRWRAPPIKEIKL